MGKEVVKNATLMLDGQRLESYSNSVEFSAEAEAVETTNFASGGNKEYVQGLKTSNLACDVVFNRATAPADSEPQTSLEALLDDETDAAFTVTQDYPPVAGSVAWFAKVVAVTHSFKAVIGQLWSGSMKFANRARAVRGNVVEAAIDAAFRDTSGESASLTIPATAATEKLVGVVHVFRADGTTPTLDIDIETDDDNGFPSATSRYSVPQFTGLGSHYFTVDGPITDTEVRVAATVGGTDPEFEYLVAIAVAAF